MMELFPSLLPCCAQSRTCKAAGGSRLTGVSTKGYKAVKLSKAGTRHFMCRQAERV